MPPPPSDQSSDTAAFIGRQRELAATRQALSDAGLVTLSGPGGVGKTRLAEQLAASRDHHFVFLADARTLQDVVAAISAVVGVSLARCADASEARAALRQGLRGHQTLLILDNIEQLRDPVAALLSPWRAADFPPLLLTSRLRLGIPGEVTVPVAPLPLPGALALLRARSTHTDPEPDLIGLLKALDCLPLAIELAASRLGVLGARQLTDRLHGGDTLAVPASHRPARHHSLQSLIAWSWALLQAPQQRLLARLAIFPERFTLAAVEAVCTEDETDLFSALSALLEHNLLRSHSQDGQRTLSVYAAVRAWVADRDPTPTKTAQGLLVWALQRADAGDRDHTLARRALDHNPISDDWVRLFLHWLTLAQQWHPYEALVAQIDTVLSATPPSEATFRLRIRRGRLSFDAGHREPATAALTDAVAQAPTAHLRALAQHRLADCLRRQHSPRALAVAEAAEAVFEGEGSLQHGHTCRLLGEIHRQENRPGDAIRWFQRAREAATAHHNPSLQIDCAISLGLLHAANDLPRSAACFTQAMALCAQFQQDTQVVIINRIIANAMWGPPETVAPLYLEIAPRLQQIGAKETLAYMVSMDALAAALTTPPQPDAEARLVAAESSCRQYRPHTAALPGLGLALLALRLRDLPLARTRLRGLLVGTPPRNLHSLVDSYLALIALLDGRPATPPTPEDEATLSLHTQQVVTLTRLAIAVSNGTTPRAVLEPHLEAPNNRFEVRVAAEVIGWHLAADAAPIPWQIHRWGAWFCAPGETPTTLGRRQAARHILRALALARQAHPGKVLTADSLFEVGWPGEHIQPHAARMRLHTTIRDLRRLGLGTLLQTVSGGYLFAPDTAVELVERDG